MKKFLILIVAGLLCLSACNQQKLQQAEEQNAQLNASLQESLANQDSLFSLLNEITDGMNQIKAVEQIFVTSSGMSSDTRSRKEQIKNDLQTIQMALQEHRERLAELEAKLEKSTTYSANLKKTIENLKSEIATQQTTISTLRGELTAAKIKIADLGDKVDSLHMRVADVTQEKIQAQEESITLANELNECYYVIGTKKELKSQKIIESGFLRKTKIMESDYDQSYFTKADKRTCVTIPTHSKKAKVLTNMPDDAYTLETVDGLKVLQITNPDKFWSISKYLVIQVD